MGYTPDWQKQSYGKTSSVPKVTQKGNIISRPLFDHQPSRLSLADGGDVTEEQLKQEGLKASADDKASLWERLKAGNIDKEGSEAYNRWGAGRGKLERERQTAYAESNAPREMTNAAETMRKAQGSTGMGDMASVKRVAEMNPTEKRVTDEPQKSKMYTAEPASEPEVRKLENPKPIEGKKLREEEAPTKPYSKVKKSGTKVKDMKPEGSQSFPVNPKLEGESSQSFPLSESAPKKGPYLAEVGRAIKGTYDARNRSNRS